MVRMNLTSGVRLRGAGRFGGGPQRSLLLELKAPDPIIHEPESLAKLSAIAGTAAVGDESKATRKAMRRATKGRFATYRRVLSSSWMFDMAPVLLTTLLLPVVWWLNPSPTRAWWVGAAGIWYFTGGAAGDGGEAAGTGI